MDSSQSLLKQRNPPNTLILVQGDPFHVSDLQNCKIINVYFFNLKKKKKKKKLHLELHYSDLINHVWAHVPVISQTFNMHPWKGPAGKYFPVEGNFKGWISDFPSVLTEEYFLYTYCRTVSNHIPFNGFQNFSVQ